MVNLPEFKPTPGNVTELIRYADLLREELPVERQFFALAMIGIARGNPRRAMEEVNRQTGEQRHEMTAYRWVKDEQVNAYIQALMAVEAARVKISRHTVIGEMATIASIDMAEVIDELARVREAMEAEELEGSVWGTQSIRGTPRGEALVRRLPRRIGRTIKKIKFETAMRTTTAADGEQVVEPVEVLSEIELHDKLKANAMLGEWMKVSPHDFDGDGDQPGVKGWKGHQIIAPQQEEKTDDDD